MSTKIKFGTDGWRGLIARDFTFDSLAKVARAVAKTIQKQKPDSTKMVVGYDCRFLSREFSETVATVYAREGFEVLLAEKAIPTPALSWCAKFLPSVGGATVITASHNPPQWNGFKFKETFGGSALPETTQTFEKEVEASNSQPLLTPTSEDFHKACQEKKITLFNPMEQYFEAVKKQIDLSWIQKSKFEIGLDSMHGAGAGHFSSLLRSLGVKVHELHAEENPGFRGIPPEPIEKNLTDLCKLVKDQHLSCGLATDGDADRLGAIDENGNYFTTQMILSVVYWHMLTHRNKKWSIARSASTTHMVDLIAKRANQNCYETPIGFKYIADKMIQGKVQIGGEESGGIGIVDHIPERDGLLTGLLLLEVMAFTGKGLHTLYQELCKRERPYEFIRLDLHVDPLRMEKAMKNLKDHPPKSWEGRPVSELSTLDGYNFRLKDGSWVLIRASGTEPIFRLYAEAESIEAAQKLVQAAETFVKSSS